MTSKKKEWNSLEKAMEMLITSQISLWQKIDTLVEKITSQPQKSQDRFNEEEMNDILHKQKDRKIKYINEYAVHKITGFEWQRPLIDTVRSGTLFKVYKEADEYGGKLFWPNWFIIQTINTPVSINFWI